MVALLQGFASSITRQALRQTREAEERCAAPLLEIYGSTETGQIACRRPTAGAEWRLFPDVLLTLREGRTWASGGHVEQEVAMGDVLEITGPDQGRKSLSYSDFYPFARFPARPSDLWTPHLDALRLGRRSRGSLVPRSRLL